jgi:hypothetical protein
MSTAVAAEQIRPLFESPGESPRQARRLLVLTYHFPPSQTAGALRWQKLAALAAEEGWVADFVTLHPAQLTSRDERRLAELPPGTRVYGVRHPEHWLFEPAVAASKALKALKSLSKIRGSRGPDSAGSAPAPGSAPQPTAVRREDLRWMPRGTADVLRMYRAWMYHAVEDVWARQAERVAHRLATTEQYDCIVSCGPPHLVHEAARAVGRAHGIPFVMDLRDPWSLLPDLNSTYASPIWFSVAERFERKAVRDAALVVMNTEPARDAMRRAYPEAADRIIAVMNGFDEDPLPPSRHGKRFTVAYAGSIYMNRDPRLTFRAAARVISEFQLTPEQFGFAFIGNADTYGGPPVSGIAAEEGIGPFVEVRPPCNRKAAMEFLADATMLLNLPQDAPLCVPSKVFEYMRFDAWILALEPRGSATELVLRDTGADIVAPQDVDGIARVLRARYSQHARGIRPTSAASASRYSRRNQASLLLHALASASR